MALTKSRRLPAGVVVVGVVTGLVLLAFVASVLHGRLFWGPKACQVLTSQDVAGATGAHIGVASSFVPDPDDARTTGCYLGAGQSATRAIVYAFDRRAASAYAKARTALAGQGVTPQDLTGSGYVAFVADGPQGYSQSLNLLRNGTYVNVLLFNAPPGTVAHLAPVVAARIG